MNTVSELSADVGVKSACDALQVPRATYYRYIKDDTVPHPRPAPPLSLSAQERRTVLDLLHSERFRNVTPYQIYAALLDENRYLCSIRTMYRLLTDAHGTVRERRRQVQRPHYAKPELLATGPNQVWSWDITKLKGPVKWTFFYLYVILDIFSRYVVGWMIAHREKDTLAQHLISQTCQKQQIQPEQLTIHADRGSSMKSKAVAMLLADLGVTKTHSRPSVSNDNPFSEAQFKTLKYCPQFPERFGSIQDARTFCQFFFNWYNKEHHHSGIALMTPEQVHYHLADQIYNNRLAVLKEAFDKHPNRFKYQTPTCEKPPEAVWINPPQKELDQNELKTCCSSTDQAGALGDPQNPPAHPAVLKLP